MSNRQFYKTPMSPITPSESFATFYDLSPLPALQQEMFNDLFALTPTIDAIEAHMWFGKKPVGFFGSGHYKLFLQSGTFTVQPGITYRVRVVGGGGGGGGSTTGTGGVDGVGGAGGGYSEKIIYSNIEEVVNVVVGAGGKGATTGGAAGFPGSTSSFGIYLSATGGGGGIAGAQGGQGVGGDINYTGGNCTSGLGGASAASDFGNGISKTTGRGGNGLQSSSTSSGGGGLFGSTSSRSGGGLWGNSTHANRGGGMFISDGGACYTDTNGNVYTLEYIQPQNYKVSNSATRQHNSLLKKEQRQGLPIDDIEYAIHPLFGKGASYNEATGITKAGFGGGACYIAPSTGYLISRPSWGGGWAESVSTSSSGAITSRPYLYFNTTFGSGSGYQSLKGGNGSGVITGGESFDRPVQSMNLMPQGGLGGGGGGGGPANATCPGGYGAVLVEW